MKKITLIILIILIAIIIIVAGFLIFSYLKQKQLEKCLEPTGRPVKTGLKYIDDCYKGCCSKEGQERQECFDFCFSIN